MTQDAGGMPQQGFGQQPGFGVPGAPGQRGGQERPWPVFQPGTSLPVDQALQQDVQQRLQSPQKQERATAERDAFIAQSFNAWQIYPVKVGRWRLKLYGLHSPDAGWDNDPISAVLFLFYLVYLAFWLVGWLLLGLGKWVRVANVVQVIDPATGRPIAEHLVTVRSGSAAALPELLADGTVAFLGDPRVCGLVGKPSPDGRVQLIGTAFRRGTDFRVQYKKFTPQALASGSQQIAATPYQEFPNSRTGRWMVDSPQAPSRGRTRWTRLGGAAR